MTTPRPLHDPAYARYVLGVLSVVYVFNFLDRQILSVLLVDIQQDLEVSDTLMGLLGGTTFALFYTLAGLPIARWADRGSRRTVLATGVAVWSLMTAACGMAQSYMHLLLARIGVGAGEAAGTPPSHALISDYYPPHQRARALAIYGISLHIGIFCGLAAGGWLNEQVGWRQAFVIVGVPGLLLAALVRLTVREPERGALDGITPPAQPQPLGETLRHLFSRRSYRLLLVGAAIVSLPGYAFSTWGPTFMRRVHDMGSAEVGLWVGLATLGGALGTYAGGALTDRFGAGDARWYMRLPAATKLVLIPVGLLVVFWPFGRPPLLLYAAFLFLGAFYSAPVWAMLQALAPPHMRTLSSAIFMFVSNLIGLGAGPLLVGVLNDLLAPRYGDEAIRYTLALVVLVNVFGAGILWEAARTLREDLPSAETSASV
jgi:predicted MFS family arabinose efflux permease